MYTTNKKDSLLGYFGSIHNINSSHNPLAVVSPGRFSFADSRRRWRIHISFCTRYLGSKLIFSVQNLIYTKSPLNKFSARYVKEAQKRDSSS